jgi:hypothetical protein
MVGDLDSELKRIKRHLDAAADYAQRAKNYANSGDSDSASRNIGNAADEIDIALTAIRRMRRDLP